MTSLTTTALVVGIVLAAIGMMILFLLKRFIKGYDDGLASNATKLNQLEARVNAYDKMQLDKLETKIESIQSSIVFNVGEREKQIAGIDRKIYDSTISQMERLRGIDDRLKDQDLKLQELKWLTLNEGKE